MGNDFDHWLAAVFSHPDLVGALAIAAKTAIIYVFLIAGLRLLGKHELGQMSVQDLVLIVLIANAVQNAMVGQDSSLMGGVVAAVTLFVMNRGFTWLTVHSEWLRQWMVGQPVLIVRDGRILWGPLRREGVTREHVQAAMHEHGIDRIENVQMAVLEIDGTISIVPKESAVHRTHRRFRGVRTSS